jgi:protocatechuate 3,4-dioxygenase beta subunit
MTRRIITYLTPNSHRRRLVGAALLWPAYSLAQSCGPQTPRQTEGPFFKPSSPKRISLVEKGSPTLVVTGRVLSKDCKPLANALVDFWHADEQGAYDNQGFRYRGHQFTDAEGRYRLETVMPALYPGRARHLHVKVQAPGGRILTTQLYFPDDPGNARDGLYRAELAMQMQGRDAGVFDFVAA